MSAGTSDIDHGTAAAVLATARAHLAAGRRAAAASLLASTEAAYAFEPGRGWRSGCAALALDLGAPERAIALLEGRAETAAERPLLLRALYDFAAAVRAGHGPVDRDSPVARRMLRLPPYHAAEIAAARDQILAIFGRVGDPATPPYPEADYSRSYTICMTPRSGSTFLIAVMTAAGQFGRPHEYLQRHEPSAMPTLVPKFATPDTGAFLNAMAANTRSPNGVFGLKADPDMLMPLLIDGSFDRTLRHGRFIYLTRQDLVMQAISLTRAQITGGWSADAPPPKTAPAFDFAQIHGNVRHLAEMMARWEAFFAYNRIGPLRLTYEELHADIAGELRRVAAHLDLPEPAPPKATRRVQRDALSEDWAARFYAEIGAAPA